MPVYSRSDPNLVAQQSEVDALLAHTDSDSERALIRFLYLTGARPGEAVEFLYPSGWRVLDDGSVEATVPTLKLGKKEGFQIKKRTLVLNADTPYLKDLTLFFDNCATAYGIVGDIRPFPLVNPKAVWYRFQKAARKANLPICPYTFRHSRMTKLARFGASIDELMYWKGAEGVKSVAPYLRAKPIGRRLEIK
jgi:integrase